MKRTAFVLGACALLAAGAFPLAAGASPHHRPHNAQNNAPRSYVDRDNNGAWSGVDSKLPPPIVSGVEYANFAKSATKVGVVIGGALPPTVVISTNGDIHITASLGGDLIELVSTNGDIIVDPGVSITGRKYGVNLHAPGGTIRIGDGARINAGGGSPVSIAGRAVSEGNDVLLTSPAEQGYVGLGGVLSFGTGDQFITAANGVSQDSSVHLMACGDLTLSHATITGENVALDASTACGETARVSVTNSTIKLDKDSNAQLESSGSPINLEGTTVTPSGVGTLFSPAH